MTRRELLSRLSNCCIFTDSRGTVDPRSFVYPGFPAHGVRTPEKETFMGIEIYKRDGENGVFALSICAVIDQLLPKYFNGDYSKQNRDRLDERLRIKMDAFAKKFNLTFYSRPREDFSVWEAIDKAVAEGFAGVIVEDLS